MHDPPSDHDPTLDTNADAGASVRAEDGPEHAPEDGELIRLFVLGWPERLWFAWVTVVIPALAFGLSSLELHLVEWKEPSAHIWPALFIDRPGTLPFLLLAMVVILVCVAIVTNPGPWTRACWRGAWRRV